MNNKLPLKVNIRKEVTRRSEVAGYYPKEQLSRLENFVISIDSDIQINYSAQKDIRNNMVLVGEASCLVTLLCVRCFENFSYPLKAEFSFIAENNDTNSRALVDQDYSPLIYDEFGDVNLLEAIEDELIISIPLNPTMPEDICTYKDNQTFGFIYEDDNNQEKEIKTENNPFASLASLKDKLKK